jgi:hypothetical protein
MDEFAPLLQRAAAVVAAYRDSLPDRPVRTPRRPGHGPGGVRRPAALHVHPGCPGSERVGRRGRGWGLTSSAGPRYFGFVIGGALPAATAADVLTTGWDQCALNEVLSPAGRQRQHQRLRRPGGGNRAGPRTRRLGAHRRRVRPVGRRRAVARPPRRRRRARRLVGLRRTQVAQRALRLGLRDLRPARRARRRDELHGWLAA